jgi:Ferritin-like domain
LGAYRSRRRATKQQKGALVETGGELNKSHTTEFLNDSGGAVETNNFRGTSVQRSGVASTRSGSLRRAGRDKLPGLGARAPKRREGLSIMESNNATTAHSERGDTNGVVHPNQPIANQRRGFLKAFGVAGAALSAGALFSSAGPAEAAGGVTPGDIHILRLLAAAELIETDLWEQYAELGGLTPGQLPVESDPSFKPMNSYQAAFMNLDPDGPQYISSNTGDERSHATFLNAYLEHLGAEPVNLDEFRTLPSSKATGAKQIGRLTNLMKLSVDTSWYTRYRSTTNPDFGAKSPQALPALFAGQFPGIPRTNADFEPAHHVQAIANTAAFHFAFIEQGGTSLYASMAQKAENSEVLQVILGIGGDEIAHFLEWVDFAGNGVQPPLAPFTDPTNGLTFPNFDALEKDGKVNPLLQTNLIFPVPCQFINPGLPLCAVIRPIQITATDAINGFIQDGLFIGQSPVFLDKILDLARRADAA